MFLFAGTAILVVRQLGIDPSLSGETPYPIFVLTGLVAWQAATDGYYTSMLVSRRAGGYAKSAYISRPAVLSATVFYAGLYSLFKIPVAFGAAIYFAKFAFLSPPALLQFCITYLGLAAFGISIGLVSAPLSLILFDFRYIPGYILRAMILVLPVFYAPPVGFLRDLMQLNPLAKLIDGNRAALVQQADWNSLFSILPMVSINFIFLFICYKLYPILVKRAAIFI